jgi:hypothetical protein
MNICSKIAAVMSVTVSLGAASIAAASGLEGTVRDSNGHLLPGAQIRIEGRDAANVATVKTNERGHYAHPSLTGGKYRVSLIVNGEAKAVINNVMPRENETEVLNFDLKRAGRAQPSSASKHYVLLQAPTGTHIDRWVEVNHVPGEMSIGMQERMHSSPSKVARDFQENSGNVRF